MEVKIGDKKVEVLDHLCKTRSCFVLGVDKGTFVPGRGYTSYHAKQRWCCQQRMLHGCPHTANCVFCRVSLVENGHCHCEQARKLYHAHIQFLKAIGRSRTYSALQAEDRASLNSGKQRFRDAYQAVAQARADDAAERAAQS
jgi:hypothetical protein